MKPTTRNLLIALLIPALAQAQPTAFQKSLLSKKQLLKTAATAPTAKTTAGATVKSLAHYSYSTGTARLNDSATATWSGARTSTQEVIDGSVYIDLVDFDQYETRNNLPGGLEPGYRSRNTYNSAGKLLSNVYENWDKASGTWIGASRTNYTYSGSTEINVTERWNPGAAAWENYSRQTTVTASGTTEITYEEWETGAWTNQVLEVYTYSGPNLVNILAKEWEPGGGSWLNKQQEHYTYTGSDVTESLSQEWDPGSSAWVNEYRTQTTYAGGLLTQYENDTWNRTTLSWDKKDRRKNTYSGTQLSEFLDENWDEPSASWKGWNKGILSYSGSNVTRKDMKAWKEISMSWEDNYRLDYNYNSTGNLVRELLSQTDGLGSLEKNTESYYYYDKGTSIPGIGNKLRDVRLYPNPATIAYAYLDYATTTAATTEVVLTDITGKVLQHINETGSIGDHSIQIPVTALANGVYFVQLISEGQLVQNLKLVR